jgi:hypothetical protein
MSSGHYTMHTATAQSHGKPKLYNPRHPERTLFYETIADHFETWLDLASAGQFDGQGDHRTPKPYVRQAFRKYLDCGIFARGFARARCGDCGHDYFVAFSCKGRGVCPSCNTRRMVETAAHLTDHVFPRLPVRQWVLRIFLRVIAQSLQSNSAGAVNVDKATLHIGAVAFINRFGSSLNEHVHFHVCVVDGVFEEVADSVIFHPASGIDAPAQRLPWTACARLVASWSTAAPSSTASPAMTSVVRRQMNYTSRRWI